MTLHNMVVFLHVVGALILFGAQAIELVGFDRLRKARTAESVMSVMGFLKPLSDTYRLSGIALAITGIYLTITAWSWHGWIVVSLTMLVALAVSGPVIAGPRMGPIVRTAASSSGALSSELTRLIRDPVLVVSFYTRSATALGIVLLMVAKPGPLTSVVVIAVAAAVGFAVGRSVLGRAVLVDKDAVPVETAS